MVSGFTSTLPEHAHLFQKKLSVPSLHVTGRADGIVPMRDSLMLAERFAHPVIIEHGGGHVIPADPAVVTRIVDFVTDPAPATAPITAPVLPAGAADE
jgi:pimeloyl-ACP methyl ester carboxylesterase